MDARSRAAARLLRAEADFRCAQTARVPLWYGTARCELLAAQAEVERYLTGRTTATASPAPTATGATHRSSRRSPGCPSEREPVQ